MTFIWPSMLFLLMLVPLFLIFYIRLQQRRQRLASSYGSFGLVQASGHSLGWRRHLPPVLFLLALTVLIIALARPETEVSLPRLENTVILAFDVSGSMAADDLKPNRMEAAKTAAREFVDKQPDSTLIGLVAFSDGGLSVQAPTANQELVLAAISRLSPQRATSLGNGILAALNAIAAAEDEGPRLLTNLTPTPFASPTPVPEGTYINAAIILLTDGENTASPDPLEAAQIAADQGVRIYTVGIGSSAGATLEVEGFTVHTQLDEAMLKQIAFLTDGEYYNAADENSLREIYGSLNPQLVIKPEKMEVTSLFTGVSLFLLLIGGGLSLWWFSRLP